MSCKDCAFYVPTMADHGQTGACHRFPPQIISTPVSGVIGGKVSIQYKTQVPRVGAGWFCGEFLRRKE